MFEKLPYPKDSYQLPCLITIGESITNTNNYKNSNKFEIVSGRAYWDQKLFDEKKPETKNLVTLSL